MNKTNLKALSRFKNKEWLKNEIADVRVGGLIKIYDTDEEVKCSECKRIIYLTDLYEDISDMIKKNHKIICPYCALRMANPEELNDEQRLILQEIINKFENDE